MTRAVASVVPCVVLALAIQTGCVVSSHVAQQPVPASTPVTQVTQSATYPSEPQPRQRFAEYITAPGQRLDLNEGMAQTEFPPPDLDATIPAQNVSSSAVPGPFAPRVQANALPVDPPLVLAVRAYLNDRPDDAARHLQGFAAPNREVLAWLLPAVALAARAPLEDPTQATLLAQQVNSAAGAIQKIGPLRVTKAAFVYQVKQFGVFDPLPPGYSHLPGGTAVVYAEVENAPSNMSEHPGGGTGYLTKLICDLQILDEHGQDAMPFDPQAGRAIPIADYTRSRLRDFFISINFGVPSRPGEYTLIFDIKDPATGRSDRQRLPFRVGKQ